MYKIAANHHNILTRRSSIFQRVNSFYGKTLTKWQVITPAVSYRTNLLSDVPLLYHDCGQVVHTRVSLSSSNIIRYWNKKLSYRRDSAGRRSLRRSGSFKVVEFGTNRKPICGFLLMINLHPISHCFKVIAYYWSDLRFRQRSASLQHIFFGVNT